ncbi:hypothetical protein [Elizabethkingia meningoseptica]|uniref:hypothetical protein n=1 Tax=Elizabethkingia meningoseptica TaxID=238 RepID=UPI003892069B
MKRFILSFTVITSAFVYLINAQANPFPKTTWKIENINTDGSIVLKKAKHINLPAEQPGFHYIQFEQGNKYQTGTSCFQMNANYHVDNEAVRIELTEGVAGMSSDCKEPKDIHGTYTFQINGDQIKLQPVPAENNEEPYDTAQPAEGLQASDPGEAVDAATMATKAIEKDAQKKGKKSKKKAKK